MDADRSSSSADILALIRARGEAAIMIALVEPAGYGRADTDVARIRADIARMQAEVLAALDTADYRDRLRYAAIPAMAGTVRTERGLSVLLAHPHVRRVDLDTGGTGTRQ
jgi:hypothetical protein